MKNETIEQNQSATAGFVWDDAWECTNPEKIFIACPLGYAAAVLVAKCPDEGDWWAGWQRGGGQVVFECQPVVLENRVGYRTRAQAIEAGIAGLLESLEADTPLVGAVEKFRAGLADEARAAATPVEATAEIDPPLLAHAVGDNGVFADPEVVPVCSTRSGAIAEVRLAQSAAGQWFFGVGCRIKIGSVNFLPNIHSAGFATRGEALTAGLQHIREQVQNGKSYGAKEIRRMVDRLLGELESSEGSPANAAVAVRPAYRTEFADLAISKIQRNPANHRKHFDAVKLAELAASLRAEGLHQPIAVRALLADEVPEGELPVGDAGAPAYELIFGERRWRAAASAGLTALPARIYHGLTRTQAGAIALVENLQRADINAMEEAEGYADLMAAETLTQEQAADRVGRGRSTVANALRLLRLPEMLREMIREGKLTAGHGIALARFAPKEKDIPERPKWEQILQIMAERAVREKVTAERLEKGVPSTHELIAAGLAVRITSWGAHKLTAAHKRHPAYFADVAGEWVCLHPQHWAAEVARQDAEAKDREEKAAARKAAAAAKLVKGGRKQLALADLERGQYREMEDVQAPLLELVPEDKKAAAKDHDGRKLTVVTDVDLADRLAAAMMRQIKKNRREQLPSLTDKVQRQVAKIKKVGPRELAWLVWTITTYEARQVSLHLDKNAAAAAGVTLPRPAAKILFGDEVEGVSWNERARGRLDMLATCPGVDLVKALIVERLATAIEDIVEGGADSVGGRLVKFWLESDTLWLLEETEEGRAELVEAVKNAPWYQKAMAGETVAEGEE